MKQPRLRLSTVMLLVAITALLVALAVSEQGGPRFASFNSEPKLNCSHFATSRN